MNRSKLALYSVFALLFILAGNTSAQDSHIKRSDLPAAVQKTADQQSKGATIRGYSKETDEGKLEYEVEMMVSGHTKDVSIDPAGNLLDIEEQVGLDTLPAPVRDGLQKQAGTGKITKVETITKHGALVAYEAKVLTDGKKSEVQVGPNGKPLDHKE